MINIFKPPKPTLNTDNSYKRIIDGLGPGAKVLDIGSKERRLKPWVINSDLFAFENVDVVCDAHSLSFKADTFDLVLADAVLECVRDPRRAVKEIYRILKKGGVVHCQMPFMQGYVSDPKDYSRLTLDGLDELFSEYTKVESGICCGPGSALVWFLREYFAVFWTNDTMYKISKFITGWIFFPLKYLDLFLNGKKRAHKISSGFYYIARKD
jgi:SAM-dependent methyltransferase